MSIFENELNKRGTKYFFSQEQPGVLDFNIWPWFERLDVFPIAYPDVGGTLLPEKSFPKLVNFIFINNLLKINRNFNAKYFSRFLYPSLFFLCMLKN